jgi:hypothetical protein
VCSSSGFSGADVGLLGTPPSCHYLLAAANISAPVKRTDRDANKAAALMDCYADPEYQAAAKLRHAIAEGWAVILEGYDGSQDIDGTMIRAALAAAAPSA